MEGFGGFMMDFHFFSRKWLRVRCFWGLFLFSSIFGSLFSAWVRGDSYTWNYAYDNEGRVTEIQSPAGDIHYEYSHYTGRKTATWTGTDRDTPYQTQYSYNPVGSLETVTYPNGFYSVYEYDALHRLTALSHFLSSEPEAMVLAQYTYSYYADGMRARAVETLWNSDTLEYDSREVTWKYDNLNRVTEEKLTGGYTLLFKYDLIGNCLERTLDGVSTFFFYNARDELLAESPNADGSEPSINYAYDDNGSMVRKTDHAGGHETVYGYNLQNRLCSVIEDGQEVASYLYHPEGYRLGKVADGTAVWYLSDPYNPTGYVQVLEEVAAGATTTYFNGLHVLGQVTGQDDPMFFLPDGHGSTRQTVQAPVTAPPPAPTLAQVHYDAYGRMIPGAVPPGTNVLYTNQRYDPHLDMYDLRRREYNPANMRFTQQDPWAGEISDPMSLHRYLYCHANPINAYDPSGEMTINEVAINCYVKAQTFVMTTPGVAKALNIATIVAAAANLYYLTTDPDAIHYYIAASGGDPTGAASLIAMDIGLLKNFATSTASSTKNIINIYYNTGSLHDFWVKVRQLQNAAAKGGLVYAGSTKQMQDRANQARKAYRDGILTRLKRWYIYKGQSETNALLKAQKAIENMHVDHRIDLQVSGAIPNPNNITNLQMRDGSVNTSVGKQIQLECERLGLKAGDIIDDIVIHAPPDPGK